MSRPVSIKGKPLPEEAGVLFDRIQADQQMLSKANKIKRRLKRNRKRLADLFGGAGLGKTPSGRTLSRTPLTRQLDALPAKKLSWNEFHEMPPWDAE